VALAFHYLAWDWFLLVVMEHVMISVPVSLTVDLAIHLPVTVHSLLVAEAHALIWHRVLPTVASASNRYV
jgi:hypothetical protein